MRRSCGTAVSAAGSRAGAITVSNVPKRRRSEHGREAGGAFGISTGAGRGGEKGCRSQGRYR